MSNLILARRLRSKTRERRAAGLIKTAIGVALGLTLFVVCVPVCGLLGLGAALTSVDTTDVIANMDKKVEAHVRKKPRLGERGRTRRQRRERKKFIQKMIADGYWQKTVFTGSLPKVWVNDSFLLLSEKNQNEFLEVAYAYWMDELDSFGMNADGSIRDALVIKKDNGTLLGRRLGTYNPIDGFR